MKRMLISFAVLLLALSCAAAEENLYPAMGENGQYGYISAGAEWVIAPQFDWAGEFRGDYAPFADYPEGADFDSPWGEDCMGVIDREGSVVLEPVYSLDSGMSGEFYGGEHTGVWIVYQSASERTGWFDIPSGYFSGLVWGDVWHWLSDSSLIPVTDADSYLCGYARRDTGELVIPCRYDGFSPAVFREGVAVVSLIDEEGEYIGDPILINEQGENVALPEGYVCFRDSCCEAGLLPALGPGGCIGYVDAAGNLVIPERFLVAWDFTEGFAAVLFPEGDCGYIRPDGTVLARGFESVRSFRNGWGEVVLDGETRYLRADGSLAPFAGEGYNFFSETRGWMVIDPNDYGSPVHLVGGQGDILTAQPVELTAMEPSSFEGGLQAVCIDGRYGFLDLDGSVVIPCIYSDAENFVGELTYVRLGDRVGYIDRAGNEVYMWDEPVE